ncbi:MAG: hypothetical protein MUE34_13655 [Acidimicrobiales bacterium]|jgi:hypothetical protein|nr:hypothetical protein [Acidimicrobiales bacterium]
MAARSRRSKVPKDPDLSTHDLSFSTWSYAGLEKRGRGRAPVRFGVLVVSRAHPQGVPGEVVDVGEGGVGLEVAGAAAETRWPDEDVIVLLRSTTGPVRLDMRVVRDQWYGGKRTLGLALSDRTDPRDRWRFTTYARRLVSMELPDAGWA